MSASSGGASEGALSDVAGVRVGHSQRIGDGWLTGVTVVLPPPRTIAGVDVRGAAPGTIETEGLDPRAMSPRADGIVLAGGSYKAYLPGDKLTGEGKYTYHADTKSVSWDTGPYVGVWGGTFQIDREGKTHKIRMKSTTIGTNSTDAP